MIGKAAKKNSRKTARSVHGARKKVKEYSEKVESEGVGLLGIAQDILRDSTDFLSEIIAPIDGVGGVTVSYECFHCHCFPLEDNMW